jgi:hypothetical protein
VVVGGGDVDGDGLGDVVGDELDGDGDGEPGTR